MKRKLWIILALATLIALLCCGTVQAIMVEPDDNTCMYGGAHTWGEWHTDKEATCTEPGKQSRQCNICLYQQVQSIQALGHDWSEWSVVNATTCTTSGNSVRMCLRCGAEEGRDDAALGHKPVTIPAVAATCYVGGKTEGSKCSVCGVILTAPQDTEALGHDPGEWVVDFPATCTEQGIENHICNRCHEAYEDRQYGPLGHTPVTVPGKAATCTEAGLTDGSKCSVCGTVLTAQETIPAKGHTPVTVPGKAATCTETGLTDGSKCSMCGTVLTAQSTIPANGHTPVTVPGKAATCTETGLTDGSKCSVCGTVLTAQNTIPASGHTPVTVPGKAATCTETGLTDGSKCSVCGTVLTAQSTIPAKGHTPVTVPGKAATCTETGLTDGSKCSVCGTVLTAQNTIPAKGHTPVTVPGKAATCTEAGLTDGSKCSVCGMELTAQSTIPAKGHNYQVTASKEPTATEDGYRTYTCSNCNDSYTETLPKTAHSHNYQVTAEKPATCTEQGSKTYSCSVCGDAYTETSPALGHAWSSWMAGKAANCAEYGTRYRICSRCGERETETDYSGLGDHVWGEWVTVKEPTATEPGLEERTCQIASSHKEQREIPATGPAPVLPEPVEPSSPVEPGEPAEDDIKPDLSLTASWAEDEGKGKAYEGAKVEYTLTLTNTGNCPVFRSNLNPEAVSENGPNGTVAPGQEVKLEPGESIVDFIRNDVWPHHVENLHFYKGWLYSASYIDSDGNRKDTDAIGLVHIDLTYPEGGEPEAPNPSLTLIKDSQYPEGDVEADESMSLWATCINSGNMPLYKKSCYILGDGTSIVADSHWSGSSGSKFNPGNSSSWFNFWIGSKHLTPGTETEEYLGRFDITSWVVGYDPDTGEKVCESNHISASWNVKRPGPAEWEIPEESAVSLEHSIDTKWDPPADPAGYQLGEWWSTWLKATNTGTVTIPSKSVTVYDPWDGFTTQINSDWKPGETHNYIWDIDCVSEEDVARGYIYLPPLQFTWTDPDSGNEKTAYSNPLTLPVSKKKGLQLNKLNINAPVNAEYYREGEPIEWKITVTNTSDKPYTDVTVTDQGVVVGHFDVIGPGESVSCSPAPTVVTEYDKAVTYITNIATVTGTDENGNTTTTNSNIVSLPTSEDSSVPLPGIGDPEGGTSKGDPEGGVPGGVPGGTPETPGHPGTPGGGMDPLGPVYGVNLGATIYKTTAHGPANGDWFALGEAIDYIITVKNIGDVAIENVSITDSLGGFAPIGTAGSIAPGGEQSFTYQHVVTQGDIDTGYVVNSAVASYTFNGGIPATPIKSNPVYSKAGENGYIPGEGMPGGTSGLIPSGEPSFDPAKLPGPGSGYTPVTGPDGTIVTTPDGLPIYTDGHGGYYIVGPDGHLIVTDEHGKPILSPFGGYVYPDGNGGFYTEGPEGGYIKCDQNGNPILDENGNYIYVDGAAPISCQLRLDILGDNEGHYTLHACGEHLEAAQAAEAASVAGTAEGWKQAGEIWREEIDKLYQILYDAADNEAKAALINDRANLYAYTDTYRAMQAGKDPAAAEQAVAEMLRLRCTELCAMVHTVPAQLPDSLLGSYAQMNSSGSYDTSSREIGLLEGSDSPVTERYDAVFARTLDEVLNTIRKGTGSSGRANAFRLAQRQWQVTLDSRVNAAYKAAGKEDRKLIAAWRVTLDQVYAARREMLDMLYSAAPEVGEEVLMNLYRNAALDTAER